MNDRPYEIFAIAVIVCVFVICGWLIYKNM